MVKLSQKSSPLTLMLPVDLPLITTEAMSEIDFDQFCAQNRDLRIEREANGKVTIMAPVHFDSGFFEGEAFGELRNFVKNSGIGGRALGPSTGFKLPDGSTKSPDASWVSAEKLAVLPPEEYKKFAAIVPDFVIEIRSDSDKLGKLKRKMEQTWMANGVRLAWLIDPVKQKAYVYRQNGQVEIVKNFESKLSGEDILLGFELDLGLLKGKE
jgi:Uma2 family endonuclease